MVVRLGRAGWKAFSTSIPWLKDIETNLDINYLLKLDYFTILGINQSYQVCQQNIATNYKQIQRKIHPDINPELANVSSYINNARRTLSDPIHRAKYLLQLNNIVVNEDERMEDPEFLMQAMELREELDSINSLDQLEPFTKRCASEFQERENKLDELIQRKSFEDVIFLINQMKYFERALGEAKNKKLELTLSMNEE